MAAGSDIDLYVYNSGGAQVGSSGSGTSAEEVNLKDPAAGAYTVYVHGWQTAGGGVANYSRGAVENNAPASANANNVESTAVVGRSPGCGTPINFAACTGNGNAPGFTRRVLTQAITTRNTQ